MSEIEPAQRGIQLGKYALVAEIARGGMGIVYLAQATGRHGFKKLVVVKELKPELGEDPRFREMFLNEASLAARLNHRNIVQTMEVDQDGDRYFFVMEYLEGRTLHHVSRLKGDKALQKGMILRIICDMLAGLHYAHELSDYDGTPLNIVHRDVSPRNVFLTYDGQVKLLDFGVAKAAGRDLETETGQLKGRVPYMAPEHLVDAQIDRRADVFSTGVMLREALTGRYLWGRSTEIEILKELIEERIPPLPDDVKLDAEAKRIIEKAMAPDRDQRYRTAHEMRTDLERYVARIDPRGSFAQAGEHISREFAEQRSQIRIMIEEHVTRAPSIMPGELPQLAISAQIRAADGSHTPGTPSTPGRRTSPAGAPSSGNALMPFAAPSSTDALKALVPPSAPSSSNSVGAPAARPPIKDISVPPPPPPSQVGRYVMYGFGFCVVVVGLTVAMLSTREPPKEDPKIAAWQAPTHTPTGRPAIPTASASTPKPADDVAEVTIFASPPVAELWVDNVSVGEGPYTSKYKRGSRHVVRATAAGYLPRVETIDVTSTTSMNLVLEKEAGAEPPPRIVRPVRPAAPVAPAPASAPPPPAPAPTTASPAAPTE